jgi:hypothetical protein
MTQDAGRCPEASKGPSEQGLANQGIGQLSARGEQAGVPADDSAGPAGEPLSAKQNDKQNDKRVPDDPDLARIAEAWPSLPAAARKVILATVAAYADGGGA